MKLFMENSIFIDSNVFIAELNENDTLHSRAKSLLERIESQNLSSITSNFVISEAITVLSQRVGKNVAVSFADFIYNKNASIDIIAIDREIELEGLAYLKRLKSKNVSFCDCATMAILKIYNIKNIATFDKDFHMKNARFKIMN